MGMFDLEGTLTERVARAICKVANGYSGCRCAMHGTGPCETMLAQARTVANCFGLDAQKLKKS